MHQTLLTNCCEDNNIVYLRVMIAYPCSHVHQGALCVIFNFGIPLIAYLVMNALLIDTFHVHCSLIPVLRKRKLLKSLCFTVSVFVFWWFCLLWPLLRLGLLDRTTSSWQVHTIQPDNEISHAHKFKKCRYAFRQMHNWHMLSSFSRTGSKSGKIAPVYFSWMERMVAASLRSAPLRTASQ